MLIVFPIPPTALSFSRTVTGYPSSDSRHAAAIPAGPAPRTTMRSVDTLDAFGDDEVIEVHGKRQLPEGERERIANVKAVAQPSPHFARRREREVIGIANREFS